MRSPHIAPEISLEYAASIGVNACTAYRLLTDFVKLNKGTSFLHSLSAPYRSICCDVTHFRCGVYAGDVVLANGGSSSVVSALAVRATIYSASFVRLITLVSVVASLLHLGSM